MVMSNSQIKVLEVIYLGIYEDYIRVEITSTKESSGQTVEKVYRLSIGGAVQGKRVAKMKQGPRVCMPPASHDGDLPQEFEEEVKSQMEKF